MFDQLREKVGGVDTLIKPPINTFLLRSFCYLAGGFKRCIQTIQQADAFKKFEQVTDSPIRMHHLE